MHAACPYKKLNHLQSSLLRHTQFWSGKLFSKPASLTRAFLVALKVAMIHKVSLKPKLCASATLVQKFQTMNLNTLPKMGPPGSPIFNPFPIVNRVSAGVPTLPDSGKTPPQLKTKFCISSLLTEFAAVMKSKLFPRCKRRIHPV